MTSAPRRLPNAVPSAPTSPTPPQSGRAEEAAPLPLPTVVARIGHWEHALYERRGYECVYIGRKWRGRPESKWHNPYHIGRDGTREEVIAKFETYILTRPDLLAALPELRGKALLCHCKPQACHGDTLIRLLAEMDGDA